MSFYDSVKTFFFSKLQNEVIFSPKIIKFKIMDENEILSTDFPDLRKLSSTMDLSSLCYLTGINSL
jgi:hypothetical protein